ncbi:MAG: hypothetical protein AB7G28_13280 [Pirellulales bacterium]
MSTLDDKRRELSDLEARATALANELSEQEPVQPFQPKGYYAAYFATTGFMLGIFGAMSSLLFNIVGSAFVGQHPLELIRVYLTFPLGDKALELNRELALAVGCCLYLGTGMLLGVPVYLALTYWTANASLAKRLMVASIISILIWVVMYYGVLSWLQPALVDMKPENWIIRRVPPWVALATHLVFGWTIALLYPLGDFTAYRRPMEQV